MSAAAIAAHADWSVDPRKRWITVARRGGDGWRLGAPAAVGEVGSLFSRLRDAAGGGAVALGVDLPLGLPRTYAARLTDARDFPEFLRGLAGRPDFFRVCEQLGDLAAGRPFYPARGVKGMTRDAHAAALGLGGAAGLSRLCDRATAERPAGAPLFWTLGANQTGKAAIAAWRDLLIPALDSRVAPLLWPFEGDLHALLRDGAIAVAETYPAEALRHLGLRLKGSKRRQADRVAIGPALLEAMRRLDAVPEAGMAAMIERGFGADAAGEDRFDSTLGVLAVLNVLAGNRPDGTPDDPWLRRWEGWVLGQTALPRDFSVEPGSTSSPSSNAPRLPVPG